MSRKETKQVDHSSGRASYSSKKVENPDGWKHSTDPSMLFGIERPFPDGCRMALAPFGGDRSRHHAVDSGKGPPLIPRPAPRSPSTIASGSVVVARTGLIHV
jgi:hypothetical protein